MLVSLTTVVGTLLAVPAFYLVLLVAKKLHVYFRVHKALTHGFPQAERHWLHGSNKEAGGSPGYAFLLQHLERTRQHKQAYVCFLTGLWPILHVVHPDTIRPILRVSDPKAKLYERTLKPWLGEGLLISSGKRWLRSRRLLTPAFHFDILKSYISVYNETADTFITKLETKYKDKPFPVFNQVSLLTLDIILKCAFSLETDCQTAQKRHPYIQAVYDLINLWSTRIDNPIYVVLPLVYWVSAEGREFRRLCALVHDHADHVIQTRRQNLEDSNGSLLKNKRYLDFLDTLLTARDSDGYGMTAEDIRAEVDTFMFEGHDTTNTGISWTLYLLACDPDVQEKVQREIDEIMSSREEHVIEWSDLNQMEYLTCCLKESMRIYPPVPMIARLLSRDCEVMNQRLPAGTQVVVNFWGVHHNPEVWGEDHWDYRPERMSPENMRHMDPFAYVPFSAGPRNCIGQNFAINEEKVLLARLLHKFTFELDPTCPKPEPALKVVLRPKEDLQLRAIPRHCGYCID